MAKVKDETNQDVQSLEVPQKKRIFVADENQTYERQDDGSLRPVYIEKEAATRLLKRITDHHIINGVRIEDGRDLNLPAEIVKFNEEEGKQVIDFIKGLINKRISA